MINWHLLCIMQASLVAQVVKNSSNAGDMDLIPGPEISHMPQLSLCATTTEPVL